MYLKEYNNLKKALDSMCGEPVYDEEEWISLVSKMMYKDKKAEALRLGKIQFRTIYELEDSEVVLYMVSDQGEVYEQISYMSLEYLLELEDVA